MASSPAGNPHLSPTSSHGEDLSWLVEILRSVQLEQFFVRIRDQLQVSRLEHFEYVQPEDLEKVGMARYVTRALEEGDPILSLFTFRRRPAARRLLDLVKKKRRKALVGRLLPQRFSGTLGGGGGRKGKKEGGGSFGGDAISAQSLTCLIHAKDITLQGDLVHVPL
jgi:receptor protein-tyrosine kinase/activated CDC42 kinase 1